MPRWANGSILGGMLRRVLFRAAADPDLVIEVGRLRGENEALRAENTRLVAQTVSLQEQLKGSMTLGENLKQQLAELVNTILGADFSGAIGVDRWSAYNGVARRQLCWAHLLRDFIAMSERFHSPWHGQRLALCACKVMALWDRLHRGEIDRATMLVEMAPLRALVKQHLTWAAKNAPGTKARVKATEILKLEPLLWTFLEVAGMAPTNNLAERLLRYAVIWRKLSFGTQSERGRLFVERVLTVTSTLTLQNRNVFDYLCDAMTAYSSGKLAPSILPVSSQG